VCLSCGCHDGYESHGNPANITMEDVKAAAEAAGISTEDVVSNIMADLDRTTELGVTTRGVDPTRGPDLDALRSTGEVRPN
jgi:hypothetical protein